jgi:hypothetical protein
MLCLAITGFESDPDRVTELLKIAPSQVARKGTPSRSGRLHVSNGWWFEVHADRLTDGGQHHVALGELLGHLKNSVDQFREIREALRPKSITVYGGLYHKPDEQCGIWLDPEQMYTLAACGISWGLDLFMCDERSAALHNP